jgi:uncharacterized protein YjgD (DUF1641 family)
MTSTVAADRLDALEAKLDRLTEQLDVVARHAETLDALLAQVEATRELVDDIVPMNTVFVESAIERLAELERRGYFSFAREGLAVIDRVVETYDEDDIRSLGDNIVLILDTVKEMTQPEVMTMLRRTFHSIEETDVEAVSMFQLLRQLRDPEVKRGLGRLLGMLRTMGETNQVPDKREVLNKEEQ